MLLGNWACISWAVSIHKHQKRAKGGKDLLIGDGWLGFFSRLRHLYQDARAENCYFETQSLNVDYRDVIQCLENGWPFDGSKRRFVKQISWNFSTGAKEQQ